jgi:flagellar biosynthesis protein FlhF
LVKRSLGADALILSSRRLEGPPALFEVRATAAARIATPAPAGEDAPRAPASPRSVLERVLEQNEVPAALTKEILGRAGSLSRSLREAREDLERVVRASVEFAGPAHAARVVAMVGPTGVGKTTTIAKLAARDALIDRMSVVLVSTDGYRIGGADQLARYADLIGVPFEVADDAQSLAKVLARYRSVDRIYIDTAGRAPRDKPAIDAMVTMLRNAGETISVHLCLTASTRAGELSQALERHAVLKPCALCFTKVDEAFCMGGMLVASIKSQLPLSWFTTGQRVPEDIEAATSSRLAGLLCGEEVNP